MDKIFLQIVNMSITSSYVIMFVIIIRLFLRKFPKILSYALWSVVLFRLISPFSIEGIFSLIPERASSIPIDIVYTAKPEINSSMAAIDNSVNNILPLAAPAASANPMQIWLATGEAVWLIGIFLLIAYSIFTTVKLYKKLRSAALITDNIYETDKFKTPFVFGIIRPKIYLPPSLLETEKTYIILHEQTHIKRFDHIIKLISFLVTCIHWFNPFVWIAFFLMGEDMELSCDESVIKKMGSDIKKEYSSSLLSMSTGRKIIGGCPIAFGENNTKGRIKNILNYKKPKFWVIVVVAIAIILIIAGLMTNPKSNDEEANELGDLKPMIMFKGELFFDTGKQISDGIDESAIIGEVNSSVVQSEKPTKDGQTNFGFIGAKYAYFEDNIVVLINDDWILFENEVYGIEEVYNKRFYIMTADDNAPIGCEYGTTRETGEIDTLEMLSMLEELQGFVFEEDYVSHQYIEFWFPNEKPKEIYLRYITKGEWQTEYPIDSATYRIKVPTQVGKYSFFAEITWENQEKETVFFDITIKARESAIYEKISAYLKEECINVFSPYYELLDFIISDYKEEVVNGNVEAVFHYKMINKNYDRDPDTVEYIKEAKESGDKYYQTYYDEYLQPQENNFYFKAVVDENGGITLYTKNLAIEGDEWKETKMSDYIIKKPEETLEGQIEKILSAYEEINTIFNGYIDTGAIKGGGNQGEAIKGTGLLTQV